MEFLSLKKKKVVKRPVDLYFESKGSVVREDSWHDFDVDNTPKSVSQLT